MPIHPEILWIKRGVESDVTLGSGFNRTRTLRVIVAINPDDWGTYLPDYFLTDDRLPALYSAYPAVNYPTTDTVTPATFVAYDPQCLMYDVSCSSNNSNLAQIVYEYRYSTNPPIQPGNLPQELRRDQEQSPPGTELGYSFSIGEEEFEVPYRLDAGLDPRAWVGGVPLGLTPQKKVVNTAGERYDQQPTRKYGVTVFTFQRLELYYRRRYWSSWSHVKNRFLWNDYLPGEACCFPVTIGAWQLYGTKLVYPVTYVIKALNKESIPTGMKPEIDSRTFWDDVILSYGVHERVYLHDDDEVGSLIPIRYKGGPTPKVPQPLDIDGGAIVPPDSADPASTTYLKLIYKDFDKLKLTLPADLS